MAPSYGVAAAPFALVALVALQQAPLATAVLRNVHHSGSSSHPSYMAQFSAMDVNVMLFANYGFEAGGEIDLSVDAKISDTIPDEIGDRSMLWILGCTEQEYDAILRAEFRSNVGYCYNGMFSDWNMCSSWNMTTVGFNNGYYHASRTISEAHRGTRELLYFFIVSCELLGSTVPLRSCYPEEAYRLDSSSGPTFTAGPTLSGGEGFYPQQHTCEQQWPEMIGRELQISLSYTFANPGGQYLSFTEEPYIVIFCGLSMAWMPITALWLWNTWRMRNTVDTALQRKMCWVPVTKSIVLTLVFVQWKLKSQGEAYRHSMPFLFPALLLARILYAAAFSESLLLIGKGWKLTREHLHPMERRNIYTVVSMYCLGCLLYYLWGAQSSSAAFLTLLVLALTYMVVLYSVWFACSQNIAAVRFHLDAIRFRDIDPLTTPVFTTYTMLRKFRSTYFGYLVIGAFTDIMTVSVARRNPWVPLLSDELLEIATYVIIGYTFRARPFEPVLQATPAGGGGGATVAPAAAAAVAAAAAAAAVEGGTAAAGGGELQAWHEGMPLPSNPRADLLFPQSKAVVIVLNPGSSNAAAIGVPPGANACCQPTMAAARRRHSPVGGGGGIEMIPVAGVAAPNAATNAPIMAATLAAASGLPRTMSSSHTTGRTYIP